MVNMAETTATPAQPVEKVSDVIKNYRPAKVS